MDDLVETLLVIENGCSEVLVDADISDALLFVETNDNRAVHLLVEDMGASAARTHEL
jgi:hypothetical protein